MSSIHASSAARSSASRAACSGLGGEIAHLPRVARRVVQLLRRPRRRGDLPLLRPLRAGLPQRVQVLHHREGLPVHVRDQVRQVGPVVAHVAEAPVADRPRAVVDAVEAVGVREREARARARVLAEERHAVEPRVRLDAHQRQHGRGEVDEADDALVRRPRARAVRVAHEQRQRASRGRRASACPAAGRRRGPRRASRPSSPPGRPRRARRGARRPTRPSRRCCRMCARARRAQRACRGYRGGDRDVLRRDDRRPAPRAREGLPLVGPAVVEDGEEPLARRRGRASAPRAWTSPTSRRAPRTGSRSWRRSCSTRRRRAGARESSARTRVGRPRSSGCPRRPRGRARAPRGSDSRCGGASCRCASRTSP